MITVTVKLSNDTIFAVDALLDPIYDNLIGNDRHGNTLKSIITDVAEKFNRKAKTIKKKANLFDVKKRTKFTFKYHEADALEKVLPKLLIVYNNQDIRRIYTQNLIDQLNQKLS